MMKNALLSGLFCLFALIAPWPGVQTAFAVCADCAASTVYTTITIEADEVDEAISYAPVYLSDMPPEIVAAMIAAGDTTGKSLRMTTADGSTELPIWVVDIDTAVPDGKWWFATDGLSISVDTDYRVYAGNPSATMYDATATYGRYNVFPASVFAFYPLHGASPLDNAAQNAYHLTASGSPTTSTNGPTEGAGSYLFSGSGQYLYCASTPVTDWPVAISGWFNSDSITIAQTVAALANNGASDNYAVLELAGTTTGDPVRFRAYGDGGSERIAASSTGYSADTWQFAQGGYDNAAVTARISGANTGTNTSDPIEASFNYISIAVARRFSLTNYLDGEVSEVTFYSTVPSANYVQTLYNACRPSATFYTVGAAVEIGGGSEITVQEKTSGFFAGF